MSVFECDTCGADGCKEPAITIKIGYATYDFCTDRCGELFTQAVNKMIMESSWYYDCNLTDSEYDTTNDVYVVRIKLACGTYYYIVHAKSPLKAWNIINEVYREKFCDDPIIEYEVSKFTGNYRKILYSGNCAFGA